MTRTEPARRAGRALTAVCASVAVGLALGACGSSARGHRNATRTVAATPVTAVPATNPPKSPWSTIPPFMQGSLLGRWQLQNRFLVLAALGDEGLATLSRPGKSTVIVFRGELSIPPDLRQEGWDHVGDPDSWRGYLFDAYQGSPSVREKLFEVTTPSGETHQFVHDLGPDETFNNSFVAVTPDGQWMVSGEWGAEKRLLVFPTPIVNRAVPADSDVMGLAAVITLDHPVRDVQGCVFDSSTQLICSSAVTGSDRWPPSYQLLTVSLPKPLEGTDTTGQVTPLGELPQLSGCAGPYEAEGIDYDSGSHTLRVEVLPPGDCGLSIAVYDYRPGPEPGSTAESP